MLRPRPYFGICDIASAEQSQILLDFWKRVRNPDSERLLMLGLMMSYKTLNGIPSKWTGVFPFKWDIHKIFVSHPLALNALHYADYEGVRVADSLLEATRFGGINMHAIQLDMIWPDPQALETYRKAYPHMYVVLQVGANAFETVGNDPRKFTKRLKNYSGIVNYVLLDKSMGRGLGLDAEGLRPFLRAMAVNFPEIGVAVAGGLGPGSTRLVRPLAEEFPDLSTDAQSKLRPSESARDPLDIDFSKRYIAGLTQILS